MKIRSYYYRQFHADLSRDIPGEGYEGWRFAELEIPFDKTAVVVMHAWETKSPEQYPGWYRAVEYLARAKQICAEIFPELLTAIRRSPIPLFHVAHKAPYVEKYPGYHKTRAISPEEPTIPSLVPDPSITALKHFKQEYAFVGKENEADVVRAFQEIDFAEEAKPLDHEGIAINGTQLAALCAKKNIQHLVYAGFAINWCLLLSPGGMHDMAQRGFLCSAFRQAVTAVENKESARTQTCKELALWRVGLQFGFVFDVDDWISAIKNLTF
jgi:nicotinamidase-related amidase